MQVKALFVDRHKHRHDVLSSGGGAKQRVLRIFDPYFVSGRKENLEAHQKTELTTRGDDHLFGAGLDASQPLGHAADRFAQFFATLRVGIGELECVLLNVLDQNVGEFASGACFPRGACDCKRHRSLHRQIVECLCAESGVPTD